MRLILTTLLSLLLAASVIFSLRLIGLSNTHHRRQHPFLDSDIKLFSYLGDETLQQYPSLENMKATRAKLDRFAWYVPVFVREGRLVSIHNDKVMELAPIVQTFKTDYFLFDIRDNEESVNRQLNDLINIYGIEKQVLIASPYRNVLTQIRNLRPQWLTALAKPEANFYLISHKLALETLASFKGDFLLLQDEDKSWARHISMDEINRRHKFLICEESLQQPNCLAYISSKPTIYSADQTSSSHAADPKN